MPKGLDPAIESAPARGWLGWLRRLVRREPERLAAFGGAIAIGFGLSVALLYAFAKLAGDVLDNETTALDQATAHLVQQLKSPQLDAVAQIVSLMGNEVVFVLGVLLLVVFLVQRRWGAAVMLLLITVGAQLLNNVLKDAFQRTRPEPIAAWIAAQQYSFPSGHAMISAAFYSYVAYLSWRLLHGVWRIVVIVALTLLVVAIGISRVYLGVHFLSDVIAGYLSGLLWTDAVIVGSRVLVVGRHARVSHRARTVRA